MLNNFQVKSLVLALLMANVSHLHGQPLQDHHAREQRQLKQVAMPGGTATAAAGTTEAEVQMMANTTPTMTMPMAMNQMGLSGMQLARYPQLYYGPGAAYPLPVPGLQTNIANNYPSYPNGGFPGAFGVPQGYPTGLMYPSPVFPPPPQQPQQQLPNGFVPQPSVDNYANLNNIVNMANIQGLQGATTTNNGFYPPPPPTGFQGGPVLPGLYPTPPNAGFMPAYASAF
ncbi:uncharacterized protein [Drosophila tropicalis]|uniref:uncharacterized protein n=1 Tax=Drosophila tropicalis TaxID=46794 RepID=UPI0035AC2235